MEEVEDNRIKNDPTKIEIDKENIKNIPKSIFNFIKNIVSIHDEIDIPSTIKSIETNIEVKGSAIWILICSIIVASGGLNFNSVAVIVGAMLISPLMGPIRGVGLAIATNDFKTLIKGLKYFGVMVVVSLVTAWIYFKFTPIKGDTSELLGRVKPQAFDILIAFFGGFAGIIATASRNKSAAMTIVPGVAIATALMPPLCTLSYGLATHQWDYALGAFYLFLLNSVFIALSTVLLLRFLNFPKKAFVNAKTEKKVKIYIYIALLLIVIPSIYKTVTIVRESIFESNVEAFIETVVKPSDDTVFFTYEIEYNDEQSVLKIYSNGANVSNKKQKEWQNKLKFHNIEDTKVVLKKQEQDFTHIQNYADVNAQLHITQEQLSKALADKNQLESEIKQLKQSEIKMDEIGKRIKSQFPKIKMISYGLSYNYNNNNQVDTLHTFNVAWADSIPRLQYIDMYKKLKTSLQTELEIIDPNFNSKKIKIYKVN